MSSSTSLSRLWERRIVRFAVVGVINTVTDLAILNLLVFGAGLKLLLANVFSAVISIILSYFWNHRIVFQGKHKRSLYLFLKFLVVTGLSIIAVQTLIIFAFQHIFSIKFIADTIGITNTQAKFLQVNGAKVLAVLGGMAWNYILYQAVVFKHPSSHPSLDDKDVLPY